MKGSSGRTVENNRREPGCEESGNPHRGLHTAQVDSPMESSKIREVALERN